MSKIAEELRERMAKAVAAFKKSLVTLRTGRATPAILDKVCVDCYGQELPIKQMASISVPDARTLLIVPWDKSLMPKLEQAILKSDLGLVPNVDSGNLRIQIPLLSSERRVELVKMAKKKAEEAKIAVRNLRREANLDLKKLEKSKEIDEDTHRRKQDEIQKLTDQVMKEVEQVLAVKEKEILEV
ncbi:MAG: hypothetical protein RLZ12_666 [Bacillota bacterium]|jgi:ribosome recycling factor